MRWKELWPGIGASGDLLLALLGKHCYDFGEVSLPFWFFIVFLM